MREPRVIPILKPLNRRIRPDEVARIFVLPKDGLRWMEGRKLKPHEILPPMVIGSIEGETQ